jgi:peptide/nickel transport system permease protein
VPGNYFDSLRLNPQISPDVVAQYEERFHINDNVFSQYVHWLGGVLRGDFGYSFTYHMGVRELIASRLAHTLILSCSAFLLAWGCAVPLGIWAAWRYDTWYDRLLTAGSYVLLSVPGFFIAVLLMYVCAHTTSLPIGGMYSVDAASFSWWEKVVDVAAHMAIPLIVTAVFSGCYVFRVMRAHTLDVIHADFVRVLRTRGISSLRIIGAHVLPNAMGPLITIMGFQLPALVSGAGLIEIMTGWPGLGTLMLDAVQNQDMFLVMGNVCMVSVLLIIGNAAADIMLALIDPRVREI